MWFVVLAQMTFIVCIFLMFKNYVKIIILIHIFKLFQTKLITGEYMFFNLILSLMALIYVYIYL